MDQKKTLVQKSIKIPKELAAWWDKQPNASEEVRKAIKLYIKYQERTQNAFIEDMTGEPSKNTTKKTKANTKELETDNESNENDKESKEDDLDLSNIQLKETEPETQKDVLESKLDML
ncbi:hypothetical protein MWH25_10420 [Natroniella acetigena]|uniref:hypothetical protein n=1 Tax=Natroniella acetigena TaxID=52004 RepID=UPI00200A2CA0|nr:hypothetical protein [Natroniella acetigena]MCK8828145.1 hypothetical protein [Natroniella acetigena]